MKKKVKVGVIGCGTISEIYLSNLTSKFSILDVVGCSDIIDARAEKRAKQFSIKKMTNQEILSNPDIEIVVNLTFPEAHYEISKSILDAGKHCLVEKMMTVDFNEAVILCDLAESKKLVYGAAPDTFLGGGWQSVRKYVDDGIIGKPMSVNAVITCSYQPVTDSFDLNADNFFFPLHPGGGLPYDLGGYYIHNMINILGPVKRVSGFGGNIDPKREYLNPHHPKYGEEYIVDTPTSIVGTLEFESGVLGTLLVSSDSSVYDSFTLQGTDGVLELFHPNFYSGSIKVHRTGGIADEAREILITADGGYRPVPDVVELPILHGYCDNNRGIGVADMAYSIRNNRPARAHYQLGRHAMEIIHGILESSKTGETYKMTTTCTRPAPIQPGTFTGNAQEKRLDD